MNSFKSLGLAFFMFASFSAFGQRLRCLTLITNLGLNKTTAEVERQLRDLMPLYQKYQGTVRAYQDADQLRRNTIGRPGNPARGDVYHQGKTREAEQARDQARREYNDRAKEKAEQFSRETGKKIEVFDIDRLLDALIADSQATR